MRMQEYITQRLEDISDPKNRELIRQISEAVLLPLFSHTEQEYRNLEERVKGELPAPNHCFTIRSTLVPKDKVNAYSSWLYPVLQEDAEEAAMSVGNLREMAENSGPAVVDTLFFAADHLECLRFELDREIFHGRLVGKEMELPVDVVLRPSKRYMRRVKELYAHFISNGVPWVTVNNPYTFKIYDACLAGPLPPDIESDTPLSLEMTYGKWDGKLKRNLVPVWNVEHVSVEGDSFPLPALDKLNYEYRFAYPENGAADGYLANYSSSEISAVRREEDALIVTSPVSKGLQWELCRFHQRPVSEMERFPYPLCDNRQSDTFAARMAAQSGIAIQTRAELNRIIHSFSCAEVIRFDSFEVLSQIIKGETYEVNGFAQNEIRDVEAKKTLLLRFRPVKRDNILNRDFASFLTSHVQLIFPEFHCVGVLV